MKGDIVRLILRVLGIAASMAAAMAVAALVMGRGQVALSIGVGAVVAMAGFAVLAGTISGSQGNTVRWRVGLLTGIGMIKLGVIGVVLWWLISRALVGPFSFLAGFSTMVAALIIEGLRAGRARAGTR